MKTNTFRPHETDHSLVWLDVSTRSHVGLETLIDRDMLPALVAFPGRWYALRTNNGGPNSSLYVSIVTHRPRREMIRLHRFVLGLDPSDGKVVSHLNHNTLDNRRANLEATTDRLNMRRGIRAQPARGYCWDKANRRWKAQVMVAGRCVHLGSFLEEGQAAAAYRDANEVIDGAHIAGVSLTTAGFRACMNGRDQ